MTLKEARENLNKNVIQRYRVSAAENEIRGRRKLKYIITGADEITGKLYHRAELQETGRENRVYNCPLEDIELPEEGDAV